ncbi:AAA family ATPase [Bradyrhizobium sp. NBAIM08]|uniref:AAA family ATPase n=1 Tax=Bradyrhizobium sp. NBAIM08 TaxID=2793815 RepID=UPI001CD1BD33|nr:AAA family ATPase [Bradyrhizobium sp. NBAIM08]MCA1474150.1 AAA family ATPase [Bradyrhizobium sp. NBAIM08]
MNLHLQRPRDLLGRAYLDMLATEAGAASRPLLRSGDPDDPIERLIDELATKPASDPGSSIRADLAAAAILVARAIEPIQELTLELRRGSPVVSLAVLGAETVALVQRVLGTCAFGTSARVLDERTFNDRHTRPVLLIARDGTAKDHKAEHGNDIVADALHARVPVFGVAPDPRRHLPRDLLRASDHHLCLPALDASAIALVIEAVTGRPPAAPIDEQLVRALEFSDLTLAIRADRDPDECIKRLKRTIATKSYFDHRGPSLEALPGYGSAREWGLNLVADLREYKAGRLSWDCVEKGLLLVGPPGVGKTQFARALANSANVALVATSVADWNASAYLSGTLAAIKTSFEQARRLAPCILFIDEIDGISNRATLGSEYREYWTQIVNLLLEMLSGIEDRPGVVVIAATNHAEHIDPAVKRAGRLDQTAEIELPDIETLAQIFRFHLGDETPTGVNLMPAALLAAGKAGADVEAWVRRAKSRARRAGRDLTLDDLMLEIRSGREVMPDTTRLVCAVHEAGHFVVGHALSVFEARMLAILDHGGATGIKLLRANALTEAGIENYITALLAGRAAEEIVLGPSAVTAGSGIGEDCDFARATQAAIDLELRFGFGTLGVMHFPKSVTEILPHDIAMTGLIRPRLDRCMARARDLITENRDTVQAVADRLRTTGYVDRAAIDELLAAHPIRTTVGASSGTER